MLENFRENVLKGKSLLAQLKRYSNQPKLFVCPFHNLKRVENGACQRCFKSERTQAMRRGWGSRMQISDTWTRKMHKTVKNASLIILPKFEVGKLRTFAPIVSAHPYCTRLHMQIHMPRHASSARPK